MLKNYLKNNAIVFILLNSANLFNYLFYVLLGRSLTLDEYGIFSALNSLTVVVGAPAVVVQLIIARFTANLNDNEVSTLTKKGLTFFSCILALFLVVAITLLPFLRSYLHIDNSLSISVMLIVIVISVLLFIPVGVLQGLRRYRQYGSVSASISILRLLFAIIFVTILAKGVLGAVFSVLFAVLCSFGYGLYCLRDILSISPQALPVGFFQKLRKYATPSFVASFIILAMGNLDVVLVRHYCDLEHSGMYAAAAVLGKIAFLMPGALLMVLFPESARANDSDKLGMSGLFISFIITFGLALAVALILSVASSFILTITFGQKFHDAGPLLEIISFAMVALASANVLVTYGMARSKFGFLVPLCIGIVFFLTMVYQIHETPMQIAKILLFSTGLILVGTLGWIYPLLKKNRREHKLSISAYKE